MDTYKPVDLIRCGMCQTSMTAVLELLIHKAEHAGPKIGVSCELCGTGFTRRKTLLDHYRVKHRVVAKPTREQCPKKLNLRHSEDSVTNVHEKQTKKGVGRGSKRRNRKKVIEIDGDNSKISESVVSTDDNSLNTKVTVRESNLDGLCDLLTQSNNIVATVTDKPLNVRPDPSVKTFSSELQADMGEENLQGTLHLNKQNLECSKDQVVNNCDIAITDSAGNVQCATFVDPSNSVSYGAPMSLEGNVRQSKEVTLPDGESCPISNTAPGETVNHKWVEHGVTIVTKIIEGNSFQYGKDVYQCNQCGFITQCKEVMTNHLQIQHSYTESSTSLRNILTDQVKKDKNDKIRSANLQKTRRPRIRKVEKQDLIGHYVCNKCNKEFSRLRYLRKHLLTHKTDQEFLCDECGKHFKTRMYLTAHRKTHNKKAFVCTQCSFTSDNAFAIHAHRQIHSEGSIICDICGFAYSDKSTLIKHKRVHDMSRPFPCSYPGCTWRFENEPSCLAHVRGHSNIQGKFKCSKCGYAFRHKHHLKRHESKMHGLLPSKVAQADLCDDGITANHVEEVIIGETVKILVDSTDASGDIQIGHTLQPGNIIITTDSEGNAINYHVTDIEVSTGCHTVLEQSKEADMSSSLCKTDGHTTQLQENYVPLNITEQLLTDIENAESQSMHRDEHANNSEVP